MILLDECTCPVCGIEQPDCDGWIVEFETLREGVCAVDLHLVETETICNRCTKWYISQHGINYTFFTSNSHKE